MAGKPFVTIDVDNAEVLAMLARARLRQDPLLRAELVAIGHVVEGHVKAAAPRSPNHRGKGVPLADSFKTRSLATQVVVRSYKPYAAIMEAGGTTPPHEITAKRAGGLSFNGMVRKRVMHPGATYIGKHFARDVARRDGDLITAQLAVAVSRSFN